MTYKPILSIGLIGSGFMGKAHVFGFATAQQVFNIPAKLNLHTLADINKQAAKAAADLPSKYFSTFLSFWMGLGP